MKSKDKEIKVWSTKQPSENFKYS